MQIIVPKQMFADEPVFWRKLCSNWPSIVHFYLRKLEIAPFYRKITKRESKSFSWILEYSLMPIIVPETDFSDEPLVMEKICPIGRLLYISIGGNCIFAPFFRDITKRGRKSFSWILEYSLMQIILTKQVLLMSQ